eukprot:5559067-Alexandrium_andersonii.AAC.1
MSPSVQHRGLVREAALCTGRPRSAPRGLVFSRRQAPPGGGSSRPFGTARGLSVQSEAFRFRSRPF